MNPRKIVVLGTGGTLAGTAAAMHDNVGYTAAQLEVGALLAAIPSLAGVPLIAEQVAQIDSKDMDDTVWTALVLRCAHWLAQDDVLGVVITHGTDTLEESAYLLHAVLAPDKPVVLTCAMRPATSLSPDGPQNIVDAIAVAGWPGARGVVAVCAGVIHGAVDVRKQHTYRLDAFGSGDAGPIGYVEEGRLRLVRTWPEPSSRDDAAIAYMAAGAAWPSVEIVTSHAGAGPAIVQALVAQGAGGIVVAGTGNGTIHRRLEGALAAAQAAGVKVVRATRCAQGPVIAPEDWSFTSAQGLSPVKARIALQLQLMAAPACKRAWAGLRTPGP